MTWVLDASAVLCWLKDEPGAPRVTSVLVGDDSTLLHAVNFVEVRYYLLRRGEAALRRGLAQINATRIQVVPSLDDTLVELASRLKAEQTPIALGDVFAVALTIRERATLLTTDRGELEKIAAAGICQIEFLR
jgi:PIN domain nuclease of toxin-antitoxin system